MLLQDAKNEHQKNRGNDDFQHLETLRSGADRGRGVSIPPHGAAALPDLRIGAEISGAGSMGNLQFLSEIFVVSFLDYEEYPLVN